MTRREQPRFGRSIRPFGAALLTALLMMTVTGCTAPAAEVALPSATATPTAEPTSVVTTPAPPTVVDGLGLQILQNRPDYGPRRLQLSVTNESTSPITVTAATFSSPQFATPATWTKPTEVPPGLARTLPVQLGAAVCPAPPAPSTLAVSVTDASGTARTVTATPADPFAVLPRIAAEDCLDDAVAALATLRLAAVDVTGTGPAAVAHLHLAIEPAAALATATVPAAGSPTPAASGLGGSPTRDAGTSSPAAGASAPGGALTLVEARSTILLAPADGDTWPLDLTVAPGDAPTTVVLDAVPARCDPHAIAEDKRGTFLPVTVTIADGLSGTVYVPAADPERLALYDFLATACGFPTD